MFYRNCKQIVGPHCLRTSMQDLPIGSFIAFGSTIDYKFCIDTVFVVGSREPWVPAEASGLRVSNAFKTCTGGSITAGHTDAQADLTLYRGATIDRPVNGMYSFVPALQPTTTTQCASPAQVRLCAPPKTLAWLSPASSATAGGEAPELGQRLRLLRGGLPTS
jgi:hypothetical protein